MAAAGYSLQSTLMTYYYRRIDTLSAIAYRGLSLCISMSPLLLLAAPEDFESVKSVIPDILVASFASVLGAWCNANAYRYLHVGVATSMSMSFATLVVIAVSSLVFGEIILPVQFVLIVGLLSGVAFLGVKRNIATAPKEHRPLLGALNSMTFGSYLGLAYVLVGAASRESSPFIAAYVWEGAIGVFGFAIAALRSKLGETKLERITIRDFTKILLYSSPTVVGSGCYMYALTLGPMGVAAALTATMIVFSSIFAHFLYGEHLGKPQWAGMLWVGICVALLKLSA